MPPPNTLETSQNQVPVTLPTISNTDNIPNLKKVTPFDIEDPSSKSKTTLPLTDPTTIILPPPTNTPSVPLPNPTSDHPNARYGYLFAAGASLSFGIGNYLFGEISGRFGVMASAFQSYAFIIPGVAFHVISAARYKPSQDAPTYLQNYLNLFYKNKDE